MTKNSQRDMVTEFMKILGLAHMCAVEEFKNKVRRSFSTMDHPQMRLPLLSMQLSWASNAPRVRKRAFKCNMKTIILTMKYLEQWNSIVTEKECLFSLRINWMGNTNYLSRELTRSFWTALTTPSTQRR